MQSNQGIAESSVVGNRSVNAHPSRRANLHRSCVGNKLCSFPINYQARCRDNLPRLTSSPLLAGASPAARTPKAGLAALETLDPGGLALPSSNSAIFDPAGLALPSSSTASICKDEIAEAQLTASGFDL